MQWRSLVTRRTLVLVAVGLLAALLFQVVGAQDAAESVRPVNIVTAAGEIIGRETAVGRAFLGIPYAKPPVGELRWSTPQPAEVWSTPLAATAFGPECPQSQRLSLPGGEKVTGAEDCLYLNIYTPVAAAEKLPVMVWIHGGSYNLGAGSQYDGSVLAWENNLIVVTINYRLGALGFYAHPALSAGSDNQESGNYGLMDQQLALQWVQTNIAAFGGDPQNVTIFGESAGGSSVCYQLASPTARGLFQKAIVQSGLCLSPIGDVSVAEAESSGQEYAANLGCGDMTTAAECLRDQPIEDLVLTPSTTLGISGPNSWGAVYGHSLLPVKPGEAFEQGNFNQVPVINGTNHDEGRMFDVMLPTLTGKPITAARYQSQIEETFGEKAAQVMEQYPLADYDAPGMAMAAITTDAVFSCSNLRFDRLVSAYVPTYAYEFSDPKALFSLGALGLLLPKMDLGAYHGAEIAYVFRTSMGLGDPEDFTPGQDELSKQMVAYWVNFARTGDPNGGDLPTWKPFKNAGEIQALAPDAVQAAANFADDHQCPFWFAMGR